MSEPIIFYDIPCTLGVPWSPNTWKIRFALNYKKIPHKTTWIEFPSIEPTFKSLGIEPTDISDPNKPYYSVPAIIDPNNPDPSSTSTPSGKRVSDSWKIIKYLDERYPDPPLFPGGTYALQSAFEPSIIDPMSDDFFMIIIQDMYQYMNPASQPYYRTTREAAFGKKLEKFFPKSERKEGLEKGEKAFDKVAKMFEATSGKERGGLFFSDESVLYADFCLAGMLVWLKVIGKEEVWPTVQKWNGGRWDKFLSAIEEKYGQVV